ncbi:MAG TPA: helix-turn-helix transcriptional regulator [Bryobacteraceae bacterium]|nr:helix-turn-helix transcriptional regulator [Bryobacteraceae bacterium]
MRALPVAEGATMYPNLKLQLWMSGIRQNRLAKMLDIDETTLSKIVNGFRRPTAEVRGRIASALKSDENWLFQTVAEKLEEEQRRGSGAEAGRAKAGERVGSARQETSA